MSDPTRLVDEGDAGATALERELVRAGKRERLEARDRDRIWVGLAAQLGAPVAPPSHGGPAAPAGHGAATAAKAGGAKALGVGAVLKGAIVVVALGGGAAGGYRALHPASDPPRSAPVTPVLEAPRAPALEAPRAPSEAPAAAPAPEGAAPAATAAHLPARRPASPEDAASHHAPPSRLAAEGRIVLEARAALRDGRPEDALRVLEPARAEFAGGVLVQEREALAIEALAKAGRRADARRRADAFLHAYPESPHAAAVRDAAKP